MDLGVGGSAPPQVPAPTGAAPVVELAENVHWDLSRIFPTRKAAFTAADQAVAAATAFHDRYAGKLDALNAAGLATALSEMSEIRNMLGRPTKDVAGRATSYTMYQLATDTNNKALAADDAQMQMKAVAAENQMVFFDIEFQRLPAALTGALLLSPAIKGDRHYLQRLLDYKPHMLGEETERALAEKREPVNDWGLRFHNVISHLAFKMDPALGAPTLTETEMLSLRESDQRSVREAATQVFYDGLASVADDTAEVYGALIADRQADDHLRHFSNPMQAANLDNDLPDKVVNDLMDSVESRFALAHRWFADKAAIMGRPKLDFADLWAPIGKTRPVSWPEAKQLVHNALNEFSPKFSDITDAFFTENRVDAPTHPGKTGGAWANSTSQDSEPYLFLNFTNSMSDVGTMAHELGHGIHFTLAARNQDAMNVETGMGMAEIASTFNEMLLFDYQMKHETDPQTRLALIAGRIEESFANVYRQTVMARYEQGAYALKASGEPFDAEHLSQLWMEPNRKYMANVDLPENYKYDWDRIPHFIDTRFYTVSYSFAHLASLALYARYKAEGQPFVDKYIDFLSAGGSRSPEKLLGAMGIDITDPKWVDEGFAVLTDLVQRAEAETKLPTPAS